jgi:putative transposase
MVDEDWKSFLTKPLDTDIVGTIQKHERTGRPMGDQAFVEKLERITGRRLKIRKPGPKPKPVN